MTYFNLSGLLVEAHQAELRDAERHRRTRGAKAQARALLPSPFPPPSGASQWRAVAARTAIESANDNDRHNEKETSMSSTRLTIATGVNAAPEEVYAVLADVHGHHLWAGENQLRPFRLVALFDEPSGPASVHATWSSTGRIPLHRHRFEDRSCVTVAEAPRCFEYTTDARIARSRGRSDRQGTYRHRYEIEPDGQGGSRLSYTFTEEGFLHPLLRLAIPGVRVVMWATGVRLMARRGVRNIATMAEARRAQLSIAA